MGWSLQQFRRENFTVNYLQELLENINYSCLITANNGGKQTSSMENKFHEEV